MKQAGNISIKELQQMADKMYGSLVKADVDVAKGILLVDMEMHSDGEAYLLENSSRNADVWGINLHPAKFGTDEFIEFDSMINLRPSQDNRSKGVDDPDMRQKIIEIVNGAVHD
jgi:hypothetical protein